MRILYGVQATGNGHITRSREMVHAFRKAGHEVSVLFSGREEDRFFDIEDLRPYTIRTGLTFTATQGRIEYLDTARNLRPVRFFRDIRAFDATGIDLVVSDFEPLSVRIAKRRGLTSIGIGHQYAFVHPIPVPSGHWLGRTVMRWYAPVDIPIGLHWHPFGQPILPPLLPLLPPSAPIPGNVLIYLLFESKEAVMRMVRPLTDWEFYLYAEVKQPLDEGHIHMRPLSRSGFRKALGAAEAVITNAGFELPSEAIGLGKKLLVKPLRGQFEQQANAKSLLELGLADGMDRLDPGIVRKWLQKPSPAPYPIPLFVDDLVRWIESGDWRNLKPLSESVWKRARAAGTIG